MFIDIQRNRLNKYQLDNQASTEEINSAYRRFSRMFHPDKHSTDPNKQKWAEQIFSKVKEAYEVLSDSHKRAIYDTLGMLFCLLLNILV